MPALPCICRGNGGDSGIVFAIEGYVARESAGLNKAEMSPVRGDTFALGIRLLRGRVFTGFDKAGSQLVAT